MRRCTPSPSAHGARFLATVLGIFLPGDARSIFLLLSGRLPRRVANELEIGEASTSRLAPGPKSRARSLRGRSSLRAGGRSGCGLPVPRQGAQAPGTGPQEQAGAVTPELAAADLPTCQRPRPVAASESRAVSRASVARAAKVAPARGSPAGAFAKAEKCAVEPRHRARWQAPAPGGADAGSDAAGEPSVPCPGLGHWQSVGRVGVGAGTGRLK